MKIHKIQNNLYIKNNKLTRNFTALKKLPTRLYNIYTSLNIQLCSNMIIFIIHMYVIVGFVVKVITITLKCLCTYVIIYIPYTRAYCI